MTEQAGNKAGGVNWRVKRNTQNNTLTKGRWHRLCRACSRAPSLSTRCVVPPRWDEHTEPTWHRWDRACSRRYVFSMVKRSRQLTVQVRDAGLFSVASVFFAIAEI